MHSHATWKPWTLARGVARIAKAASSTNEQESLTSTRARQSRGSIEESHAQKPQPYKRLAIVNVQAQAKAEQPISSHTLAYGLEEQRIPPGRPSMNATVEGRERQTQRRSQRRGQRRHTHWVEGASQALVKPSQHAARMPLEHRTTLTHTISYFKEEGRCGVVTTRIYLFKKISFFKLN